MTAICFGDDLESKCYWQERFWQLWKVATLETREKLCDVIANEDS
jgi:hypothetical protein